jgi:hypothetical protein
LRIHAIATAAAFLLTILTPLGLKKLGSAPTEGQAEAAAAATTLPAETPAFDVAPLLGTSGNLRAYWALPGDSIEAALEPVLAGVPAPGVHTLGVNAPDGDAMVLLAHESWSSKPSGYRTGRWPTTGLAARNPNYAPPAGFIAVTAENQGTAISERFALRDFLTHDQQDVWPKVLVLRPKLIDKLELIGNALEQRGLPSRIHVMSGFRTPQYNARGVGEGGRASFSRHTYGDAADIWVDGNGDGQMDDLNRDGRVSVKDAQFLLAVAEEVEAAHPELVGGMSAYRANSAHGPFVHVDTRGHRARW